MLVLQNLDFDWLEIKPAIYPLHPVLGYLLKGASTPDNVPTVKDDNLRPVGRDIHAKELSNHRK